MSDDEKETERLRKLVLGICDGQVFTSHGLDADEVQRSFMVLAFASPEDIPKDATLVWEELSKAGPRSVNGLPCFFSCHFETRETHERVIKAVQAEMARRAAVTV